MAVRKRKRKAAKKRPVPTNPALYARVKAEANNRDINSKVEQKPSQTEIMMIKRR